MQFWELRDAETRPDLHSRVSFVHELEELVHHCLEEFPVCSEETRILPNHVPEHH